jgi:hypothetical protein
VVDEVGYIPFDPEAANLMFSLVSARYERASMIVTSNKPFSAWGEIFGDEVVAAAMIDRLVHHAEILALKASQSTRIGPLATQPTGGHTLARAPERLTGAQARPLRLAHGSAPRVGFPPGCHFSAGAAGPPFDRLDSSVEVFRIRHLARAALILGTPPRLAARRTP